MSKYAVFGFWGSLARSNVKHTSLLTSGLVCRTSTMDKLRAEHSMRVEGIEAPSGRGRGEAQETRGGVSNVAVYICQSRTCVSSGRRDVAKKIPKGPRAAVQSKQSQNQQAQFCGTVDPYIPRNHRAFVSREVICVPKRCTLVKFNTAIGNTPLGRTVECPM